jgi:hypothetical protein
MTEPEYSIRNFRGGDEKIMSEIFNQVITEFDTDFHKFSAEQIKHYQPFYGSHRNLNDYQSQDIKFLLNTNNTEKGYVEASNRFGRFVIHYPIVLRQNRSKKTLNMLFKSLVETILKRDPKSIRAIYNQKYKEIHNFFTTQINPSILKINKIHETKRLGIFVKDIDCSIDDFEIQPFTRYNIDTLVKFRNSSDEVLGTEVSVESLNQGFEDGKHTDENTFLIYNEDKLSGWVCAGINKPPFDYDKSLRQPIGVLRGIILDSSVVLKSLRKALFCSVREFYHNKGIEEFRIWTKINNDPYSFCNTYKDYGFKPTQEFEYEYDFEI